MQETRMRNVFPKKFMVVLLLWIAILAVILWQLWGAVKFEIILAIVGGYIILGSIFIFLYFLHFFSRLLAYSMGFDYITGLFEQPRLEGIYKDHWWQIHFASRDYGESWGMPRTYVKLQYKEKKEFDRSVLKRYENCEIKGEKILSVEHIVRPYKNYLLLRRMWFMFDKNKLYLLMDTLLEISRKAEIRKK